MLALVVLATGTATVVSAGAVIPTTAFPSKVAVKSELNGVGAWRATFFPDTTALGARPRSCRSDLQLLAFTEDRGRSYFGAQAGRPPSVEAFARIKVYRYASTAAARAAVKRNATYPDRCPRVVEWVCDNCDGIATTWRTAVTVPRVGQQSTAWSWRELGMAKATGYTVVARRGATVVVVDAGRDRYVDGAAWTYPRLIAKTRAVAIARLALSTAA